MINLLSNFVDLTVTRKWFSRLETMYTYVHTRSYARLHKLLFYKLKDIKGLRFCPSISYGIP